MKRGNERGAAAVEFAILLPVLMLILMGIVEFGMIMYSRELITNASREGARAGIVQTAAKPTAGDIGNVVMNYLTNTGLTMANVESPVDVVGAGGAAPNTLTVTVRYRYDFFVPAILGLGNSINLAGQTVMRHE